MNVRLFRQITAQNCAGAFFTVRMVLVFRQFAYQLLIAAVGVFVRLPFQLANQDRFAAAFCVGMTLLFGQSANQLTLYKAGRSVAVPFRFRKLADAFPALGVIARITMDMDFLCLRFRFSRLGFHGLIARFVVFVFLYNRKLAHKRSVFIHTGSIMLVDNKISLTALKIPFRIVTGRCMNMNTQGFIGTGKRRRRFGNNLFIAFQRMGVFFQAAGFLSMVSAGRINR
jgi:hypothetical protein